MVVALMTTDILVPNSGSLKEKRGIINHIRDRVRNKFNVSVAEVDFQDKWQRSCMAFALVSNDRKYAEETMQKLFVMLDKEFGFEILQYRVEFF